jgi:hypothetical protein
MKKIIVLILFAVSANAQVAVSRATLKTLPYGWVQRIVPPNTQLNNTFASFYHKLDDPATGTSSLVLSNGPTINTLTVNSALSTGHFSLAIGKSFYVKEGANARQGSTNLAAGTVTIGNTTITDNTRFVSLVPVGVIPAAAGNLTISSYTVGVGFTILSSAPTATCRVDWELKEGY